MRLIVDGGVDHCRLVVLFVALFLVFRDRQLVQADHDFLLFRRNFRDRLHRNLLLVMFFSLKKIVLFNCTYSTSTLEGLYAILVMMFALVKLLNEVEKDKQKHKLN